MTGPINTRLVDAAVWTVAQRLKTFSYASLAAEAHIGIERATRLVRGWHRSRAVLDDGLGDKGRRQWRLAEGATSPIKPGLVATVQGNLWRSMQMLGPFCPTDLAAHSSAGGVFVTPEDASGYCQTLLRADYLRVVRKAIPGKREAIYRLLKNTGPKPPILRRVRALVDQNLGEIVHIAGGML